KTVAHWPLDETYEDIRENGFDAVPNGNPVFVTGTIGSHAVDLDGDDYLDCGNDQLFDLKNSGTISTWIKTDRLSYSWASIAGKGRWTWRLCRNATANTAAFHIDTVNGAFAANGTLGIIDGQWHHVVGTYDDNSLSLYVDGQLDVSVPASGAITPTADPVWIGGRSDAERFWEGSIDDVRIFNYALTAATIEALYQGLNCTEVSKYDLNTDCIVNMLDLAIFMEEWLQCGLVPQSSCYYTTE
ncbi:MAG: LamG domain-containing protein, partial [Anaerohalosphaera sp.]|nr:LamG domain-containing protein [Anaerohalosphaera sp.]